MIIAKNIQSAWDKNRAEFLKLYAKEQLPRLDKHNLEKRFVFSTGQQVYGYPVSVAMPVERLGKMRRFMMHMSRGLSGKELHALVDKMDAALTKGIGNTKNASVIGAIIEEIREREKMVIHTDLMYNYIAVMLVLDDEDAGAFNREVHLRKVELLKAEVENGNGHFFFQLPELKKLQNLFNMSDNEWKAYFQESDVLIKELKEVITFMQENLESQTQNKTSTST